MAISFFKNNENKISLEEFIDFATKKIRYDDEDSLLECSDHLLWLANNKDFFVDFLNKNLSKNLSKFQINTNYNEQSFMIYECSTFYIRVTFWPKKTINPLIKEQQDITFSYDNAHDHNFSLLTAGYKGEGYWTKLWEYDHESVIGYPGEKVKIKFLEETNLCDGKAIYYRPSKDIHLQLPPKEEDSIAINIILRSQKQFAKTQFDFDIQNSTIKNVIYGSAISKFGLFKLTSLVHNEITLDLLKEIIHEHKIPLVRQEALKNFFKIKPTTNIDSIISPKDDILKKYYRNFIYENELI